MSDSKEILQMASDICLVKHNCNDVCNPTESCAALKFARKAVEKGYKNDDPTQPHKTCSFCSELAEQRDLCSYHKRKRKMDDGALTTYSTALVQETFLNGDRVSKLTSHGYALNFCPECGRSLLSDKQSNDVSQHVEQGNRYIVCVQYYYLRDMRIFDSATLSDDVLCEEDFFDEKYDNYWKESQLPAFVDTVNAENSKEAQIIVGKKYNIDPRLLFAIKY